MSKLMNTTPQKRQLSRYIAMLLLFSSPLAQAANQAICQHTLIKGETVAQIAQQQQMSVSQLHTFNILHGENFKTPFDQLKTGTVILTPCNDKTANQSEQALANLAAGAAASTTDKTAYLEDYARQYAVNQVNTKISNELSPWGHAQIQLNVDRKGNFNGSNATMLIPLKNTPQWLTFTQLSIHNDDNHEWTGNIGIGERYFTPTWMLGANTFYDRNFNADQQRMGVGLEYWRNDFKLSTNGYFRLSNTWHDSTQLEDYEARPANGWDLDLQSWLPQLPQLGGELKVAHYYGEEVGLMGDTKNDLQKNPYSMMVGLNYTPFPLATFSLSLNSSDQHERDVRFSVSLDLLFGQSLASQLDPTSVSTMRSLMGQRLDFVNRNNNIVLEYRKKILLIMSMIPSITGQAGEQYQLNTKVDTVKYAPATITISAPSSFDSNGGSIINNGSNSFSVKLPNYNVQTNNQYILTGIATDREGNQSQPVYTTVNVVGAAISALNSTVNLQKDIIWVPYPAASKLKLSRLKVDPTLEDTVTIKLKDQSKQPVTGQADELTLTIKNADKDPLETDDPHLISSHPRAVANEPGTYTDKIMAGSDIGKYNVFVSIPDDNLVLNPNGLPFEERYIPDESSLHFSDIVWNNQSDPAVDDNAKDFNEITVTVLDQYGNFAAPGTVISFSAPYSGGSIYSSTGNWQAVVGDEGTASIYLYSNEEISGQEGNIVASLDTPTGTTTDNINIDFIPDVATAHVNKISAPSELMVKGDAGEVTADVVDNSDSPVPNVSVQFSSTNPAAIFSSNTVNSDANGQAKVQLSNTTQAGNAEIKATSPNNNLDTNNTATVVFTPHKSSYSITNMNWSNMQQPAVDDNPSSTNTVIATVVDSAGNPATAGTIVTFAAPNSSDIQPKNGSWQATVTGSNGQATIQLIGTKTIAGDAGKITAYINGSSQSLNVSFIPDVATAHVNRISAPNELMVKGSAGNVVADIVDNTNNPVPNVNIHFSSDNTAAIFSSTTANSDAAGQATVKINNTTTAGRATITASSPNSSLDQNNTTSILFTPYATSYSISNLRWTNTQQPAVDDDATSTNNVVATVTDSAGNPASPGTVVTFSAPHSSAIKPAGEAWQIAVTGDKGQATIQLMSNQTISGDAGQITAYINGTSQSINIQFVPDTAKAHINQITVPSQLMVNGAAGEVMANVVDNTNNPVPNMAITFSSNNPAATFSSTTATTDMAGQAIVQLSNTTKSGPANITATSANSSLDSNNTKTVLFTPHTASYSISNMTWANTQQPAVDDDSNSANNVVVTITDSAGNPATPGTVVTFTAPNSNDIQPVGGSWQAEVSGNNGQATIQFISNKTIMGDAGKITAYINGVSQSINISFIPDIAKAHVNNITAPNELMVKGAAGEVMANVVDNTNNPVPNANVTFSSNNPEVIFSSASANSNTAGQAIVNISNNTKAGSATIQATSKNSSLDTNNSTTVQFTPNSASYSLSNITWSNIQHPAVDDDNASTNTIIATVTDSAGNPALAGTIVTFSAPSSSNIQPATGSWQVPVTGNNGQATIQLVSNQTVTSDTGKITATINGTSQSLNVSFIPDTATAHVEKLNAPSELMIKGAAGDVIANVVDNTNNPVPNVNIQFSSDNSAVTFNNKTASTDMNGQATVQVSNTTKAGSANIKAVSQNSSLDSDNTATILFTPHTASYSIGTISWSNMTHPAVDDDNLSTNTIVATVTDSAGNPAKAGTLVSFSAPNSSDIQPVGGNWQVAVTGNNGQATIQLISNKTVMGDAGKITANINGSSQSINLSFIPDVTKAHIKLLSTPTAILTGSSGSPISASVVDETDNPVPNVQVNFVADNPIAKFNTISAITDSAGIAHDMLSSLQTGLVNITASSPNPTLDNSNIQRVTFKVNPNTYQIGSLVWSNKTTPAVDDEAVSYNTIVATLLDGDGKPVPAGTLISFSAPNSSDIQPAGGTWQVPVTGSNGQATIQLTSNKTITGDAGKIVANINGTTQSINISFIADTANAHINKLTAPSQLMVKGSAGNVIANVVDNTNNPVPNVTVQFNSNDSAAIFSNASATSDAAGQAMTQVSNNTKAGLININAISPNSSLDRNSTATVLFTPHTASYSIGNISWSNMQSPA